MVSFLTPKNTGPGQSVFDADDINLEDILALDYLAARAWPATETTDLAGWLMRFAHGVSRRANSVAPFPLTSNDRSLDERIYTVETFYRAHDLPVRFQISPAAAPGELEPTLTARGYVIETPVSIQIASVEDMLPSALPIDISTHAPDSWWDIYIEGFSRDARDITKRALDKPAFAYWRDDQGKIAAIGLGVMGGQWLGIFGMWTSPSLRGKGIGKNIIRALSTWAVDQGGIGLYLQVEDSNPKARRLYERIGFRHVYGYHYRTDRIPA